MGKGHFIQNTWIPGTGEEFLSDNPATGENIWNGSQATELEIEDAIKSAQEAFPEWRDIFFENRYPYLKRFKEIVLQNKETLAATISLETGKPLWESILEVEAVAKKVDISYEAFQARCGTKKIVIGPSALFTRHRPHGVTAVLGPFNFPAHLPHGHIIPALLAGNTVIFKGSEWTPLTSEKFIECWEKAGLPKGVLNLLQGGKKIAQQLALHPAIDGLFFTGSWAAGLWLHKAYSSTPEKILALEMGGNNPLIISDFSDPEAAAYLVIQSAFLTSGQRCSCARRLIVIQNEENEKFIKVLLEMINSLLVGKFTDSPEPFMGPVIHLQSMIELLNAQATLGSLGGIPLMEMKNIHEGRPFLSPGLMDVTPIPSLPDEEYFGPFLQLIRVPTFEAALNEANKTRFGLTAGLVSLSEERYLRFTQSVKAGIVNWNMPLTGASSHAPFGGIGRSGNHHPSGYYAADYCSYPVASMESHTVHLPKKASPGIKVVAL